MTPAETCQGANGALVGTDRWPEPVQIVGRRLLPGPLFPAQEELLRRGDLLAAGSALVLAPTGCGKSVLGLLALLPAVAQGRVGVMLAPTRALAGELHATLARAAEGTGLAVALATREACMHDDAIARGDIDLVVAVYEKGLAFLRGGGRLAQRLGTLVLDEVQVVHEGGRGGLIECGITSLLHSGAPRPVLVALSSCLERPGEISAWLGIPIIRSESRPVPLREGVLDVTSGAVTWSPEVDNAPDARPPITSGETVESLIRSLCDAGRRVILFVPTRRMAWDLAVSLAPIFVSKNNLSHVDLLDGDSSAAAEALRPLLSSGIGVHTSELPQSCRARIEDAFRMGLLRAVVATPTLAQGVNLCADVVLHWPEVAVARGDHGGFGTAPIPRAAFTNAGGRAGRPGGPAGEGWSLVLARDAREARRIHASLFGPLDLGEHMGPPVRPVTLEALACLFPCDGAAESLALRRMVGGLIAPPTDGELDLLLAEGARLGLWKTDGGAVYRLTGAGRAVARGGCRATLAARWARLLWGAADDAAPFSLVLMACEGVPGWFPEPDRRMRPEGAPAWRRIRTSRDAVGRARAGFDPPSLSASQRALVAETLLGEDGMRGAEERHGLLGGTLEELAAEVAWQLELIAGLADHYRRPVVANLARRLAGALGIGRVAGIGAVMPPQDRSPAPPPLPPSPGRTTPRLEFTDPATGLVRFDGREVRLPPVRFDFLLALAEAGPSGISKNDLVLRLWGEVPREEQQLFYHRREIERALLGREPSHPGELVETLPKWGFRLPLGDGEVAGLEPARRARSRAA